MNGHQAPGPDFGFREFREFSRQSDIVKVIIDTTESLLSTIAALRDVVGKNGATTLGILAIAYFPVSALVG